MFSALELTLMHILPIYWCCNVFLYQCVEASSLLIVENYGILKYALNGAPITPQPQGDRSSATTLIVAMIMRECRKVTEVSDYH